MKRIFVGIRADEVLVSDVLSWRERYQEKLSVRWISADNLHVTLIPPWYEDDVAAVFNKLEKIRTGLNMIEAIFQRVTFGPNPKNPRLIWAEAKASQEIYALKSGIEDLLGIRSEKRGFKPHMTLARFKERDYKLFSFKQLDDTASWKMKTKSFQVFESILSPSGAEYKVLREIDLR